MPPLSATSRSSSSSSVPVPSGPTSSWTGYAAHDRGDLRAARRLAAGDRARSRARRSCCRRRSCSSGWTSGCRCSPAAHVTYPSASRRCAPRSTGASACLEPDQRLFARLSVFAGGCTLDAAEAVCGTRDRGVTSLVDKSLVRAGEDASAEGRFTLLDTIREFASEQLEASGEVDEIRLRHATYFCGDPTRCSRSHTGAKRECAGATKASSTPQTSVPRSTGPTRSTRSSSWRSRSATSYSQPSIPANAASS